MSIYPRLSASQLVKQRFAGRLKPIGGKEYKDWPPSTPVSFVLVVSDAGHSLADLGPAATWVKFCVAGKPQARDVREEVYSDGLATSPWP